MSTNLTPKQKLFAHLAKGYCGSTGVGLDCALARAGQSLDNMHLHASLHEVGASLGFTFAESSGIMDGWDVTVGYRKVGIFASDHGSKKGYAEGYAIGAEAAKRFA